MLGHLRSSVGPLKRRLAWPFLKLGCTPTSLSALGILLAVLAATAARWGAVPLSFGLALASLLTDLIDGEVARQAGRESPEGNYLDAMGDRLSECILLFGLLPLAPNLTMLALAGGCLVSFAKARCALVCLMDNRDWPGWGDYPDRAALITLAYLLQPASSGPLLLLSGLTAIGLVQRVRYARSFIRAAPVEELQPYLQPSSRYQR